MITRQGRVEARTDPSVGLPDRLAWSCRRWAERKAMYSRAAVATYAMRAEAHRSDGLSRTYRRHLARERLWARFVWGPLVRILGIEDVLQDFENLAMPGDRSILRWLDSRPDLVLRHTGGYRFGTYLEWYSLPRAPWSGQQEDWLLYTDTDDTQDVEGPLSEHEAARAFDEFDEEYVDHRAWTSSASWLYDYDDDDDFDYEHAWTPPVVTTDVYANSPVVEEERSPEDDLSPEDALMLQQWRDEFDEERWCD